VILIYSLSQLCGRGGGALCLVPACSRGEDETKTVFQRTPEQSKSTTNPFSVEIQARVIESSKNLEAKTFLAQTCNAHSRTFWHKGLYGVALEVGR